MAIARTLSAFVLAATMYATAHAQNAATSTDPLPRAKPEEVGMSSERLADIAKTLNADIARGQMPGVVLAVARHGKRAVWGGGGPVILTSPDRERSTSSQRVRPPAGPMTGSARRRVRGARTTERARAPHPARAKTREPTSPYGERCLTSTCIACPFRPEAPRLHHKTLAASRGLTQVSWRITDAR